MRTVSFTLVAGIFRGMKTLVTKFSGLTSAEKLRSFAIQHRPSGPGEKKGESRCGLRP